MYLSAMGLFTNISFSLCFLFFPVVTYIYWLFFFTYFPPTLISEFILWLDPN